MDFKKFPVILMFLIAAWTAKWSAMAHVEDTPKQIAHQQEKTKQFREKEADLRVDMMRGTFEMPYENVLEQRKLVSDQDVTDGRTLFLGEIERALFDGVLTNGEYDDLQETYLKLQP